MMLNFPFKQQALLQNVTLGSLLFYLNLAVASPLNSLSIAKSNLDWISNTLSICFGYVLGSPQLLAAYLAQIYILLTILWQREGDPLLNIVTEWL